jgi:pimeloyl-ACP methyl ester carboxylesterase
MLRDLGEGLAGRVRASDGSAVLWLHGYTMDSRVWDELWDLLPGLTHIGVDLPGHGGSPPVDTGDLPALGARIARLARRHDARHVVALSFGTLLALQAAIEDRDAFDTVTLAAPALAGGPEDPAARIRYLQLAELYHGFGPGPALTSLWLRSPPHIFAGLRAFPRRFERVSAVVADHRWTELGDPRTQRLAARPHRAEDLARITASVVIVRGDHELAAFVRCAELIRAALPGTRELVLPGLGHLCLLEDPGAAAEALAPQLGLTRSPS